MNEYKNLVKYYDEIMEVIDYKKMLEKCIKYLNNNANILDLACGSGTLAILLGLQKYNVTGIDINPLMIDIAKEKSKMNHLSTTYHVLDMTDFNLNKKYELITCFFDSINMLDSVDDIQKLLDNVYNHLSDEGYFIFDVISYSKFLECNKLIFKDTCSTFKYKWKIKTRKPNIIKHKIKIFDDKKITEKYNEYYYDYNILLNDKRFNIVEISSDYNDTFNEDSDIVLCVLSKKL